MHVPKGYNKQKAEAATRVYFERAMAQYRNSRGVRGVKVFGANDKYVCEACWSIQHKEFSLEEVPELPHKLCTSVLGCRCGVVPVVKSADETRFKKQKAHK